MNGNTAVWTRIDGGIFATPFTYAIIAYDLKTQTRRTIVSEVTAQLRPKALIDPHALLFTVARISLSGQQQLYITWLDQQISSFTRDSPCN